MLVVYSLLMLCLTPWLCRDALKRRHVLAPRTWGGQCSRSTRALLATTQANARSMMKRSEGGDVHPLIAIVHTRTRRTIGVPGCAHRAGCPRYGLLRCNESRGRFAASHLRDRPVATMIRVRASCDLAIRSGDSRDGVALHPVGSLAMIKVLLIALAALLPGLTNAQSVVCKGKIINEGVTKAEVAAACGAPTQVGTDAHDPGHRQVGCARQ